jgi:uncharacterized RDD family membrane protein YckC
VWAKEDSASVPAWRIEVSTRLREYRKRRQVLREGPAQPGLGFSGEGDGFLEPAIETQAPAAIRQVAHTVHRRPTRIERVEIDLLQPSLDFSRLRDATDANAVSSGSHRSFSLPIASLHERRLAGLVDAGLLLLAYGVFLALFSALGGQLTTSKTDVAILLLTMALFYTQYFTLFTLFGGATPGMMVRRLRVATFEGTSPTLRHLLWRSFGYVVSAGTMNLGFLWAVWDEERLCWHDRMSRTCLTWVEAGYWSEDGGAWPCYNSERLQ